jgi:hypothetical protein
MSRWHPERYWLRGIVELHGKMFWKERTANRNAEGNELRGSVIDKKGGGSGQRPRVGAKGSREAPSSLRCEVHLLSDRMRKMSRRRGYEPRFGLASSLAENRNSRLTSNVENLQFSASNENIYISCRAHLCTAANGSEVEKARDWQVARARLHRITEAGRKSRDT